MPTAENGPAAGAADAPTEISQAQAILGAGALQRASYNSASFSSIAADAKGIMRIFDVGAERMPGYAAADVVNTTSAADLHDHGELVTRAAALSTEFGIPIAAGFAKHSPSRPRAGSKTSTSSPRSARTAVVSPPSSR